ncbi:hypothetical protein JCM30471_06090 [Desulfuromonas carbonis]
MTIPFDPALRSELGNKINNRAISDVWTTYSTADFPPLIEDLGRLRQQIGLNDWGYLQLVRGLADSIQPTPNDAELFTWFLLTKSGYLCKVGYYGSQVYLLAPASPVIYETPYFNLNGARFYNLTTLRGVENPGRILTYGKDYPGVDQPLALNMAQPPTVGREPFTRELRFSYAGKSYLIKVAGSRQVVRFLDDYPQTDFPVFFAARMTPEADSSLLDALRPLVEGKTESEAVNLLLRFVQTAFSYQTDDEQFGKEKYLFVDETLFFPYSDCEDRSILFSFLVRRLTGLPVVGLHFPGHVATAVRFSGKVPGDSVVIAGERYTICDPTYINANIGMAMPQFRTVNPEIIPVGL